MKPKTFSKKELNGKCPFCSFREIHKGMLSYGVKVGGGTQTNYQNRKLKSGIVIAAKRPLMLLKILKNEQTRKKGFYARKVMRLNCRRWRRQCNKIVRNISWSFEAEQYNN